MAQLKEDELPDKTCMIDEDGHRNMICSPLM